MLVLSRKVGESVIIGDDLVVTVKALKGDVVRLTIEAPKSVPIMRGELKTAADVNREAAALPIAAVTAIQKKKHIKP